MWPSPRCYYDYHYYLIIAHYVLYVTYIKANANLENPVSSSIFTWEFNIKFNL